MKKLLLIISFSCFAQQPLIQWQKTLGGNDADQSSDIKQTTDGGFIVCGFSNSSDVDVSGNHGGNDYWISKLTADGTVQWKKSFGGTASDFPGEIIQTADGGYATIGRSNSNDGDISENHGQYDFWLIKIDGSGNLQWQQSLGGTNFDQGYSLKATNDGGFIVAGNSNSAMINGMPTGNHGSADYLVMKLDAAGNILWHKSYGGSANEGAWKIILTNEGGYAIVGYSLSVNGDVVNIGGSKIIWVVKITADGTLEWQKAIGDSLGDSFGYAIKQTSDNGYIVGGENLGAPDNHGLEDAFLAKLSSSGALEWQKSYGGAGRENITGIVEIGGSYIFSGRTTSNDGDVSGNHGDADFWLVKADANGVKQWQKCFGGSGADLSNCLEKTNDGGFIISGSTTNNDGDVTVHYGSSDFWIVKLSPEQLSAMDFEQAKAFAFPNPTSDFIKIQMPSEAEIDDLTVLDLTGKSIINNPESPVDVRKLSNGMYILQIKSGEKMYRIKFIKQ